MKHLYECLGKIMPGVSLLCALLPSTVLGQGVIIDGDDSDWSDIPPIIQDPIGDYSGYEDVVSIKVTHDSTYLYVLFDVQYEAFKFNNRIGDYFIHVDSDFISFSGCFTIQPENSINYNQSQNYGAEYLIVFSQQLGSDYLGDYRDCSASPTDFPGSVITSDVNENTFIEFAIPISSLQSIHSGANTFAFWTSNDQSKIGFYSILENDQDHDGVIDPDDNCIATQNPNQNDEDGDGIGDACDPEFTAKNGAKNSVLPVILSD